MPSESEQEEEEKEEEIEVEECIHSVRLQQTKQEERRRKGEEQEDEMPGAGEEKDACSRRPDGDEENTVFIRAHAHNTRESRCRRASKGACRTAIRRRDRRADGGGQEHGARMVSEVANLGRRAPVRRRRYTGSDWKNI